MNPIDDRTSFEANTPGVVAEEFEDEIVIVNLETGQYFATRGTGAEIWRRLTVGTAQGNVREAMEELFDAPAGTIAESFRDFVEKLADSGLIRARKSGGESPVAPAAEKEPSERRPFEPPELEVYDDMQDLLVLDPIHEVDDGGWPHAKAEDE